MAACGPHHGEARREAGAPRRLRQCRLREPGLGEGPPQLLGPCAASECGARGLAFRGEQIVGSLLDQAHRLVAHWPLT